MGFDINCGVRFMALDATVDDMPNLKNWRGASQGIQQEGQEKAASTFCAPTSRHPAEGAHAAVDLGHGHRGRTHLESNGLLKPVSISQRTLERE